MMDINVKLFQWFINFLIKKPLHLLDKSPFDVIAKNEITSNKELAEKLHKPVIRKFEKRKVHSHLL